MFDRSMKQKDQNQKLLPYASKNRDNPCLISNKKYITFMSNKVDTDLLVLFTLAFSQCYFLYKQMSRCLNTSNMYFVCILRFYHVTEFYVIA